MDSDQEFKYFGPAVFVLLIFTYVGNTLLCLLIFTSKQLRQSLRYWFIVGTAVCDLLAGMISCLWVTELYGTVNHTCASVLIITAFASYAMEFVNFWYLVALNIDYCVRLFHHRLPELSRCGKIVLYLTLTLLPWIGSCLVIIPGVAFGLHDYTTHIWSDLYCPVLLTVEAAISLKVISCLLPTVIIIITIVIMLLKYQARNRTGAYVHMTSRLLEDEADNCIEAPSCYIVPCVLTIVCSAPIELYGFGVHNVKDFHTLVIIANIMGIILYSKAAILPFVWLIVPEIRAEIKRKCNRRLETGRATYRRFPEQHDSGEVTISHSEEE